MVGLRAALKSSCTGMLSALASMERLLLVLLCCAVHTACTMPIAEAAKVEAVGQVGQYSKAGQYSQARQYNPSDQGSQNRQLSPAEHYRGVTTDLPNTVRIALVQGQVTSLLEAEEEFTVLLEDGEQRTVPAGKYFVHLENGQLCLEDGQPLGTNLVVQPLNKGKLPKLNRIACYGILKLQAQDQQLLVINQLGLEDFVACVLPPKTMVVWPDEVIKAQAVAARSYVRYWQQQRRNAAYDLSANDRELPYCGIVRIHPDVARLMLATKGCYLSYDGAPAMAVTTSSSGGRTEAAALPYLSSVPDYDQDSPDYSWERSISQSMLENLLAQQGYGVGTLNSVRLSPLLDSAKAEQESAARSAATSSKKLQSADTGLADTGKPAVNSAKPAAAMDNETPDRTATGRVRYMVFSGSAGSCTLTGAQVQELLSLPSTCFQLVTQSGVPDALRLPLQNSYGMEIGSLRMPIKLENSQQEWRRLQGSYHILSGGQGLNFKGHGSGHGMGLSLWGARGLVNDRGLSWQQLLQYYYPGTWIVQD